MKSESAAELQATHVRMALRYCSRCGALQIHPADVPQRFCARCRAVLAWIGAEEQR